MAMKTWLVTAIGCVGALAAVGMPAQAELEKAQGIVTEVMRTDVAAFNAKRKSADDVANAALGYADEAQGEAARFLLLKGAFYYRVRAANYDGAMDVIAKIRRDVKDVPDKTLVEILSSALRRVPRKHCGQLYDLLQRTQDRVRYAQEARDLRIKARTNPSDTSLHTALGERYVLLGDWKKALSEFALGADRIAEAAALEQKASAKPGDVADAWWELAGTDGSDRSLAFRAHAVRFYRAALADGSLVGLKKTIASKRIDEAKADGLIDEPENTPPVAAAIRRSDALATSSDPVTSSKHLKPLDLDLGDGVKMELVVCPAGTFTMGCEGCGPQRMPHKVTISRPFWAGKYLVTREQWNRFMPPRNLKEKESALGGIKGAVSNVSRKEIDAFCRLLTMKYQASLPKGYLFRLPTLAEHQYIWRANSKDPNDPYSKPRGLNEYERRQIAVGTEGKKEILQRMNIGWDEKTWAIPAETPTVKVGLRKPNGWGIYDCVGNADQWVLDVFPIDKTKFVTPANDIPWQDAIDPLFWDPAGIESVGTFLTTRLSQGWGEKGMTILYAKPNSKWGCLGFRLVVGPDLLKERGITPPATGK